MQQAYYKEAFNEEVLKGRAAIYEYLYMAYYKVPEEPFFNITREFCNVAIKMAEESTSILLKDGSQEMQKICSSDFFNIDNLLAFNAAFTKLFRAASRIYDREYKWREKEKERSQIIIELTEFYKEANIALPKEINMPIDSFSMQLYFMFKTGYPLNKSQLPFMENHLMTWAIDYLEEVASICNTEMAEQFYNGLAKFTAGFLADDLIWLKEPI